MHLWEIDIRDELIRNRDLELIRAIFPLFRNQTLGYTHVFYKPVERGDLELVKALVEGGMQACGLKQKYVDQQADVLLYALHQKRSGYCPLPDYPS